MQSLRNRISEAGCARQVAGVAASLFGLSTPPRETVFQVAAVTRRANKLAVLAIEDASPKSVVDGFVLHWSRAIAAGIIISGKLLRDEPSLRYDLQGPGRLPMGLHAYRREVVGNPEPPWLIILTSGKQLNPEHPVFRSWARPVIFTDRDGAKHCEPLFAESRVQVVAVEQTSPRAALEYLGGRVGVGNVSIEAGPSVARALHTQPAVVNELFLSSFRGPQVSSPPHAGVLMTEEELASSWRMSHQETTVQEDSGAWSFAHYNRLPSRTSPDPTQNRPAPPSTC